MGLITHEELKPQTPLELWVTIPGKREPFYTRGRVVWSKPISSEEYRVGVELEKAEFINFSSLISRI
ncbi:MAG: PilZ domain-containing protein [Candidatus Omnitrophica bacterium]|nr:PilZ domain-containing protein [Candidatus Omnitrophota bacterium]